MGRTIAAALLISGVIASADAAEPDLVVGTFMAFFDPPATGTVH